MSLVPGRPLFEDGCTLLLIIFTDLDGTLLNSDDYRYDAAVPVLATLKTRHVPVIPVTSKTRKEVEVLCQALSLAEPFITENGSGVFIPAGDRRFELAQTEAWDRYQVLQLGCTYADARQGLHQIAKQLDEPLVGFGDLRVEDIMDRTGLSAPEAELAKARDFTEPFVTPKTISPDVMQATVDAAGFRVVVGDRFSHLIGQGAGKGNATRQLIQAYRAVVPDQPLTTIGLGNSPNDRDMLDVVDIPIIVPGRSGPHPGLADRGWQVAPAPGSEGWAKVVGEIIDGILDNG